MKRAFSLKNIFLKIFLPLCVLAFSTCDLLQETPKDFLEDYGNIAQIKSVGFSVPTTSQGAYLNVGSDADLTITYLVENPGNHRLRAEISLPNGLTLSDSDFIFPENDDLRQSWTEVTDNGAGNVTQTTHTETETNFLLSTFSIKIPKATLASIDGDNSKFDISPTVLLYRADFGAEERIQTSHTTNLLCNTPPAKIEDALGQMIEKADGTQELVLAIKLPALKTDDKYLHVSENGRTHTFLAHFANGDSSTDGSWTIFSSDSDPKLTGMQATYENGPTLAGADCFIITDIDIKGRSPFGITLTLTDEGGLSSSFAFTSHGQKLLPPVPASVFMPITDESDGLATYTLQAESGATISYTATQKLGGTAVYKGSGVSPLAIKLPAGDFEISAVAKKAGFVDSDPFTEDITVTPSVFFVSRLGSDTDGNGSKSKPFATISEAAQKAPAAPANPIKVFLLTDLVLQDTGSSYGNKMILQGCKGGNVGSRVTIAINFTVQSAAFEISGSGDVEMRDMDITQDPASSTIIGSGVWVENGARLALKNVSITGIKNLYGGVYVKQTGTLDVLGGVKITGNTKSDAPYNLNLAKEAKFNVYQGSLAGTQIGISTEDKPDADTTIKITDGYGSAGYGTAGLVAFTSDETGYGFKVIGDEAALVLAGGSGTITPPSPPTNIIFSPAVVGNMMTIRAEKDDGTEIPAADFTTFSADIWQGSYSLGEHYNLKTNNPFDISSLSAGTTYVIKITATYAGTEYSDELYYTKTP